MADPRPSAPRPVFVDPSGRRSRVVGRLGWIVAAGVLTYLSLVLLALLGPPGLSQVSVPGLGPVLPGPGAAELGDGPGRRQPPAAVLERSPSPAATGPATRPPVAPSTAPTSAPPTAAPTTVPPAAPPATAPSALPPPATSAPGATRRPTAPPTTAPTAPPGASRRPTEPPR